MGLLDDEMPTFLVHGYVLIEGDKMSRVPGQYPRPQTFADTGVEAPLLSRTASLVGTWFYRSRNDSALCVILPMA